jgi:hypothetical protein
VTRDQARVALGAIRLTNGVLATLAPTVLMRRLGITRETNPAATYVFRMFGIRTIFLGLDLLAADGEGRRRAIERAPAIHAVDALAALAAGASRQLSIRGTLTAAAVSIINLGLAVVASREAGSA